MLEVPVRSMENVYVVSTAAIADDGPDKVVFIEDGDSFKSVPVEVAYQNEEVAVLPINKDTRLFPGDALVLKGAYALSLALKSGGAKPDAHAGHNH